MIISRFTYFVNRYLEIFLKFFYFCRKKMTHPIRVRHLLCLQVHSELLFGSLLLRSRLCGQVRLLVLRNLGKCHLLLLGSGFLLGNALDFICFLCGMRLLNQLVISLEHAHILRSDRLEKFIKIISSILCIFYKVLKFKLH